MPYESMEKTPVRPHSISMEGRERLSIKGVEDVSGFDESLVVLTTVQGELTIHGQGLHIDMIDLNSGQIEVRGHIQELSYDEPEKSGSFWARLFG